MSWSSLKLAGMGHQDCKDGHSYGPGIQWVNVIHYVIKGAGYLEVEGKKYRVEKGECFFFGKIQVVKYYPDMNDPWEYKWICFGGDDSANLIEKTAFNTNPVCKANVGHIFDLLIKKSSDYANFNNLGLLYMMFAEFVKQHPATKKKKNTDYYEIAKKYIDTNCTKRSFSVTEMAKNIGIERTYIYKLFRENENESVKEYVIDRRLDIAKKMFKDGYTQIKMVAFSVGYTDPLYFSNAFKKKYGLSPRNYIKSIKNPDGSDQQNGIKIKKPIVE